MARRRWRGGRNHGGELNNIHHLLSLLRFTLYFQFWIQTQPRFYRNFFCSFSIHIANDSRLIYTRIYNDEMVGFEYLIYFYCIILYRVVEQAGILDIPFFTAVAFIWSLCMIRSALRYIWVGWSSFIRHGLLRDQEGTAELEKLDEILYGS